MCSVSFNFLLHILSCFIEQINDDDDDDDGDCQNDENSLDVVARNGNSFEARSTLSKESFDMLLWLDTLMMPRISAHSQRNETRL